MRTSAWMDSIERVIQTDAATVSLHPGLAGLRCEGRDAGEGVGYVHGRAERPSRPIPAELESGHLVAWRLDGRQRRPHGAVGCVFMIPDRLHIGTEPAEIIARLVTDAADERVAALTTECETGEAAGFGEPANLDLLPGQSRNRAMGHGAENEIVTALQRDGNVRAVGFAIVILQGDADRDNSIHIVIQRAIGCDHPGPARPSEIAAIDAARVFFLLEFSAKIEPGCLRPRGERAAEQKAVGRLVIEPDSARQRR